MYPFLEWNLSLLNDKNRVENEKEKGEAWEEAKSDDGSEYCGGESYVGLNKGRCKKRWSEGLKTVLSVNIIRYCICRNM